jgi:hypothetical protein
MVYYVYDSELDVKKYLTGKVVVLGRGTLEEMISLSERKDMTTVDPMYISDIHCLIDISNYPCEVQNRSRNRVFINGISVDQGHIMVGDSISLGPWKLRFLSED